MVFFLLREMFGKLKLVLLKRFCALSGIMLVL